MDDPLLLPGELDDQHIGVVPVDIEPTPAGAGREAERLGAAAQFDRDTGGQRAHRRVPLVQLREQQRGAVGQQGGDPFGVGEAVLPTSGDDAGGAELRGGTTSPSRTISTYGTRSSPPRSASSSSPGVGSPVGRPTGRNTSGCRCASALAKAALSPTNSASTSAAPAIFRPFVPSPTTGRPSHNERMAAGRRFTADPPPGREPATFTPPSGLGHLPPRARTGRPPPGPPWSPRQSGRTEGTTVGSGAGSSGPGRAPGGLRGIHHTLIARGLNGHRRAGELRSHETAPRSSRVYSRRPGGQRHAPPPHTYGGVGHLR